MIFNERNRILFGNYDPSIYTMYHPKFIHRGGKFLKFQLVLSAHMYCKFNSLHWKQSNFVLDLQHEVLVILRGQVHFSSPVLYQTRGKNPLVYKGFKCDEKEDATHA